MADIGGVPPSSPIAPKIPAHKRERQRQQPQDDDEKKRQPPVEQEIEDEGDEKGDGPHIDITV